MKRFALSLLIALCIIYGWFAVCVPYFMAQISPNSFEDGQLTEVESLGRFVHGQYSSIRYELWEGGEIIIENCFTRRLSVRTERQKNGVYTIKRVRDGNRFYEKTLRDHPEVLVEAEKVLQLGRDNFAKAKKKLEQRSKHNQPARLG